MLTTVVLKGKSYLYQLPVRFKAPFGLGEAMLAAKTPERLGELLELYACIYGDLPEELTDVD
jgi:hypothetical protein